MIDPKKITDYNRSQAELEEFLLFCVMVAGHNAHTTAKTLNRVLNNGVLTHTPFVYLQEVINICDKDNQLVFNAWLASFGVGCYNRVAKTIRALLDKKLNLAECTVQDLESIHGIGPKTARFFVTHSRSNQRFAILDTHILSFMRERGVEAPKSTPSGKKYAKLEAEFLKMVDASGMSAADFDLMIWKSRAVSNG